MMQPMQHIYIILVQMLMRIHSHKHCAHRCGEKRQQRLHFGIQITVIIVFVEYLL